MTQKILTIILGAFFALPAYVYASEGDQQLQSEISIEQNTELEGGMELDRDGRGRDRDRDRDRDRGRRHEINITCESHNYRYAECHVGGRIQNVWIVQKHSRSGCEYGRSWGHTGRSLWVDRGCRATFRVVVEDRGRRFEEEVSLRDNLTGVEVHEVKCQSWDYQYATCYAGENIINVSVAQKHSNAGCIEGYSWGYSGNYIWVNNGCRATFRVESAY